MRIEPNPNSSSGTLTERIAVVPLLFAVSLGASLVEFHELLFPPKVTDLNFWALFVVYLSAFASWFGWHEAAHRYPYTRKPIARLRAALEAMVAITWAGLLFIASQAANSLVGYLWGFVIIFGLHILVLFVRRREWQRPEAGYQPLGSTIIHGSLMVAASTAYSIWALVFPPIPKAAIWIFVFVPLAIVTSYRWPQEIGELPGGMADEQAPKIDNNA